MEDKKSPTPEEIRDLREQGKAPQSHCATHLLIVSVIAASGAVCLNHVSLKLVGVELFSPESYSVLAWLVVKAVVISVVAVVLTGLLSSLGQTAGLVKVLLLAPHVRWFSAAKDPLGVCGGGLLAIVLSGVFFYLLAGKFFQLARESQASVFLLAVSLTTRLLVGISVVSGVSAVVALAYARWRFRHKGR